MWLLIKLNFLAEIGIGERSYSCTPFEALNYCAKRLRKQLEPSAQVKELLAFYHLSMCMTL